MFAKPYSNSIQRDLAGGGELLLTFVAFLAAELSELRYGCSS
jgi:hypothetical protein